MECGFAAAGAAPAYEATKEDRDTPEASHPLQCKKAHPLQLCGCAVGSQLCDRCSKRIDCSFTYRCRTCDYDLCERCFSSAKQAAFL
eukprot:s342_g16.t1